MLRFNSVAQRRFYSTPIFKDSKSKRYFKYEGNDKKKENKEISNIDSKDLKNNSYKNMYSGLPINLENNK